MSWKNKLEKFNHVFSSVIDTKVIIKKYRNSFQEILQLEFIIMGKKKKKNLFIMNSSRLLWRVACKIDPMILTSWYQQCCLSPSPYVTCFSAMSCGKIEGIKLSWLSYKEMAIFTLQVFSAMLEVFMWHKTQRNLQPTASNWSPQSERCKGIKFSQCPQRLRLADHSPLDSSGETPATGWHLDYSLMKDYEAECQAILYPDFWLTETVR